MQWQRIQTLILFIIGLLLVAFLAQPVRSISTSPNMIVALQPTQPPGNIKIKRAKDSDYKPAFLGAMLAGADNILLAQDAIAEIMCQNLDSWRPSGGREYQVSAGCGGGSSSGIKPIEVDTIDPRAINDPNIPYLISPRDTILQPSASGLVLRWNPVSEAKNYNVSLIGPGVDWSQETTVTQLTYRDTDALKPGSRYWLIVRTDGGQSSRNEGLFGFTVLTSKLAAEVATGKTKIEQKQLSPEANALALARFYQGYDLNQEAITVLEAAIAQNTKSAAIYRFLGDSYKYVGLNRLAVERYRQGITLAQTTGDIESEEAMENNLKITSDIIRN
ncbi:MAG: hypothetical protein QNJ18_17165 [Xenococcaceae cyanobacterium MO_167.B52]|nr:hypothetical protein [Xenococcaceae cyanobacterium MO_167.B52]